MEANTRTNNYSSQMVGGTLVARNRRIWRKVLGWNVGDRCIAHIPNTSIRLKAEIRELGISCFFRGKEIPAVIVLTCKVHPFCGNTEIVPLRNLEEYHE